MYAIRQSLSRFRLVPLFLVALFLQPKQASLANSEVSIRTGTMTPVMSVEPIPNSALAVAPDAKTAEFVRRRWEHLRATMNRSTRSDLLKVGPKTAGPQAVSLIVGSPSTNGNPLNLVVDVNSTSSVDVPDDTFRSSVNEPSAVGVGTYGFTTHNWYAASTTNDGLAWTGVNPFAGPFPEPIDEGFCCDQQTAYDPVTNSIFWVQQLIPDGGTTGSQRINVDMAANGTWDCAYDFTTRPVDPNIPNVAHWDLGNGTEFGEGNWPDYPDLATSDSHLFIGSNILSPFAGAVVVRATLAGLGTCSTSDIAQYTDTSGFGSFRFAQGATDTMYFADHASTSSIRVWAWPAGESEPTGTTVGGVTPWLLGNETCPGPGGGDICGFLDSRLHGGFANEHRVGWVWSPRQDPSGGFDYPYARIAVFDTSGEAPVLAANGSISSPDAAVIYASAATNGVGVVGGTFVFGGGNEAPACYAYLMTDDLTEYEDVEIIQGENEAADIVRSGDYLTSRRYAPDDSKLISTCFALDGAGPEGAIWGETRYVRFGSGGNFEIFSDGFESGTTNSWM